MKNNGVVQDYNGYYGSILDEMGNVYQMLEKDVIDKDVTVNDNVQFIGEVKREEEVSISMARFVRVLKK